MPDKNIIAGLKLTESELKTIVFGVSHMNGNPDWEGLRKALDLPTKQAAEKRWSRLRQKNFGVKESEAGSARLPPIYMTSSPSYLPLLPNNIHLHITTMASPASPAALTLKQADIDLLVAICKQLGKVDTKQLAEDLGVNVSAAGMRWKRFKDKAFSTEAEAALKQADVELLLAVCEQFGEVDTKKLSEKLGCTSTAAYKRWKRFKERTFGVEKKSDDADGNEGEDDGQGGAGMSATPKTPKRVKKSGGSGKRAREDSDGEEAEGTPTKKPTSAKKAKARTKKAATQSEEVDHAEADDGGIGSDEGAEHQKLEDGDEA